MSSPASLVTRAVDAFYWRRLEGVVSRQLFRYAFCGGMNLALDAVWYFVIYHFLIGEGRMIDLGFVYMSAPIASLFLVFPITFFTGFWLNRNVAFRASPLGTRTQLLRYALSVAGAILLNYLCMKLSWRSSVSGLRPRNSRPLSFRPHTVFLQHGISPFAGRSRIEF